MLQASSGGYLLDYWQFLRLAPRTRSIAPLKHLTPADMHHIFFLGIMLYCEDHISATYFLT